MLRDTGCLTKGGPYSQIDKKYKNKEEKCCTDKALAKKQKNRQDFKRRTRKKIL